jgi:hypothetical protein
MGSFRRNPARDPRRPADRPALELPRGSARRVAGLSFHTAAITRVTDSTERTGSGWNFTATLIREPKNEHDPNAIAVWIDDQQIGHVNREDAAALAPLIDRIEAAGRQATCTCHVWGHDKVFGAELWLLANQTLATWIDGALSP